MAESKENNDLIDITQNGDPELDSYQSNRRIPKQDSQVIRTPANKK